MTNRVNKDSLQVILGHHQYQPRLLTLSNNKLIQLLEQARHFSDRVHHRMYQLFPQVHQPPQPRPLKLDQSKMMYLPRRTRYNKVLCNLRLRSQTLGKKTSLLDHPLQGAPLARAKPPSRRTPYFYPRRRQITRRRRSQPLDKHPRLWSPWPRVKTHQILAHKRRRASGRQILLREATQPWQRRALYPPWLIQLYRSRAQTM